MSNDNGEKNMKRNTVSVQINPAMLAQLANQQRGTSAHCGESPVGLGAHCGESPISLSAHCGESPISISAHCGEAPL